MDRRKEIAIEFSPEFEYMMEYIFEASFGVERPRVCLRSDCVLFTYANSGTLVLPYTDIIKGPKYDSRLSIMELDAEMEQLLSQHDIPVLGAVQKGLNFYSKCEADMLTVNVDVLGTIFYILTRSEEIDCEALDDHGRFAAAKSHAYKNGYLQRPVVDEYMEMLWHCMKILWPELTRKQRQFSMMLTHDVDEPFEALFRPAWRMVRSFGSDLIRRRDWQRAITRSSLWYKVRHGDWYADRAYTFDKIMDLSESVGCKDAFYFIPDCSGAMSGDYCLDHHAIKGLIRHIYDRGHEVGYHGSYETYLDPEKTMAEVQYLKKIAASAGVDQARWGGRQHYLRWSAPQTWCNYENAGLDYDTTLSFADAAGFRCGTSQPFHPFDVKNRRELKLTEYPLTVMECSVLSYMGYNYEEAFDYMKLLKNQCRKYDGVFVFLWHNSAFDSEDDWTLYEKILRG